MWKNTKKIPLEQRPVLQGEERQEMFHRCRERAFYLLEAMPRTEKQLRDKLLETKTGYPLDVIEEVMALAKEYHYIDDEQYARDYLQNRATRKSKRVLFMELQQKGIDQNVIKQVFDDILADDHGFVDAQQQAILTWIRKKTANPKELDFKERNKLYQSLMRRGFTYGEIQDAMKEFEIRLEEDSYEI